MFKTITTAGERNNKDHQEDHDGGERIDQEETRTKKNADRRKMAEEGAFHHERNGAEKVEDLMGGVLVEGAVGRKKEKVPFFFRSRTIMVEERQEDNLNIVMKAKEDVVEREEEI